MRLRLVTSQGSPYPSRSPRAHPSGRTRTQGLSHMDSPAPRRFASILHAASCLAPRSKLHYQGPSRARELLPLLESTPGLYSRAAAPAQSFLVAARGPALRDIQACAPAAASIKPRRNPDDEDSTLDASAPRRNAGLAPARSVEPRGPLTPAARSREHYPPRGE